MDDISAITIVDELIADGVQKKVSDIHIESVAHGLRVRYRIDGMLYDHETILDIHSSSVIARIKIMACIDIAEKRIPQDGKFVFQISQGSIDIRISTFPGIFGEKIVVRILDCLEKKFYLDELGFNEMVLQRIKRILLQSHGFFLVTGPTGSGKSTTLYSILSFLKTPKKNIVTLEDPIEYTIEGITQAQIHPDIGFDFAHGMRSLLRQDPDIIMIGEIRDYETAAIAVQAALTGHLVLSTIHTNDAVSTIIRFLDIGIKAFLLNATLNGVIAQRLVRRLCDHCKYQTTPSKEESAVLQECGMMLDSCFQARGCDACRRTGYQGRIIITELLIPSTHFKEKIHEHASYEELLSIARSEGMLSLQDDMCKNIQQGITTIDELLFIAG